jgi:hypothetical protein
MLFATWIELRAFAWRQQLFADHAVWSRTAGHRDRDKNLVDNDFFRCCRALDGTMHDQREKFGSAAVNLALQIEQ